MNKLRQIYFLIIICLASWSSLSSQQYNFVQYSVQDGLPQSQVFAGLQDSRGYIWFGTQGGGISRFDGTKFMNFTTKNGLPSNYINALIEDSTGTIWIGSNEGVCYYDGNNFHAIGTETAKNIRVNTLLFADNTLWIGSDKGLYQYNPANKSFKKYLVHRRIDHIGINDILITNMGIWIATTRGLWRKNKAGKVIQYNKKNGLNGDVIMDILLDSSDKLWVSCFDGGINVYDKEENKFVSNDYLHPIHKPLTMYEDGTANVWVGTRDQGIYIINELTESLTNINEKKGLPHNHVRSILKDNWNNTWICTSGGGVSKYLGQFFIHFDTERGLSGKYIYALCNDQEGNLLFSASNTGLSRFDDQVFNRLTADSNYIDVKAKTILSTKNGSIWVGTEGKGIVKMDTSGNTIFTTDNGLPSNWIKSIVEDSLGNIWAATSNKGIASFINTDTSAYISKIYTREDGLPDLNMSQLILSPDAKIWFATKLGKIGYFENDYIAATYGADEGLPNVAIRSIAFDKNDNIWVGTAGKGLYTATLTDKDLNFTPFNSSEGQLFSDNIYSLLFDPDENLWVGSEAGVDEMVINEAGVVNKVFHFGKNEGFHGIETCQNAALVDKNGDLWFGTMNGLMKHRPSLAYNIVSVPTIHFKSISLFYKPIEETPYKSYIRSDGGISEGLTLPYDENHLNFEFRALNLNDPKGLKYRWRLKGSGYDWSPYADKESVDYSNLPAGEYCFEVQAITSRMVTSKIISSCFIIEKPYWQEWWVRLLVGIVFITIIGSIIYRWKSKIEAREKKKIEQLRMENHVLQLEQKALQLQMNPHFIFNALNSIQSLIATKEYGNARGQIQNFATLMRSILTNSRAQKISLEEEINVLKKYLEIEQFCQSVVFDFEITIMDNIEVEEIEIPPMILQPFVENAVIHGIAHLHKSGKIDIKFGLEKLSSTLDLLVITIADNGVGRIAAENLGQSTKKGHKSVAMDVTSERLLALGKNKHFTPLQISDIMTNNIISGTMVTVKIPVTRWE